MSARMTCKSCGEIHYAKLEDPPKCVRPERCSCNYGEKFPRCEFMKFKTGSTGDFIRDSMAGHWVCTALLGEVK